MDLRIPYAPYYLSHPPKSVCGIQDLNFCKYVVYDNRKEFMADMKNIYNAPNKEIAAAELDNLKKKWGRKVSLCHTFQEK
ncbi:hypothetical protein CE91St6_28340 [Phocaeicola dorei]|jgi:hypothetical protein|uniref:Uncharacterized protein n=1 Tax=Phocaeicola dorei TaxID=357276 RepID=A0AA37KGP7_9BACT|nr:hypothetical protein CE91St6_28340 [Phocaeicola dorei]GKH81953.1 hypothetical protein CE91St7_28370 [Phocaeicola dorei]